MVLFQHTYDPSADNTEPTEADPGILEPGSAAPVSLVSWPCFLGLEIVLMPLYTIPYAFVVRVENKIHIVNSAC